MTATREGPSQLGPATAPRTGLWRLVALLEVTAAATVIVLDLGIPTFVVLALAGASLLLRRESPSSLGFTGLRQLLPRVPLITALVVGWTLLEFGLVLPLLNRATGEHQEMGTFGDLEGNLPLLLTLVAVSWTLAAVGEEAVYRGFVLTRATEAFGRRGLLVAVLVSSALFGIAHAEQGTVGVIVTFLDALFFCYLRLRFGTLWAAVLAHGLINTIGVTTFYFVGPLYGLW